MNTKQWQIGGLCLALALMVVLGGCSKPAQLGNDEEVWSAADARWTAVTAKRGDLLENTAGRIDKLHASAKLPDDAFEQLSAVIATARSGEWSDARVALKAFVRGQRRQ